MSEERTYRFGNGTLTINGFSLVGAEAMAVGLVAAGLMTPEEANAALERRRMRREIEVAARLTAATQEPAK